MTLRLPSSIAEAVSDPKCATTSALESGIRFYDDQIEPEALDLMTEEFMRRGGDPEFSSTGDYSSSIEAYL